MKSKKGFSAIIVVVIVATLIALLVAGVIFFMKNQPKENAGTGKVEEASVQTQNSKPETENTNTIKETASNTLTKAELSVYNTMQDSNYLTVVLYDPLKDRAGSGDKNDFKNAILVTYDFGEGLKSVFSKDGFTVMAENKQTTATLKYYFGLLANNSAIYQVTCTNGLTAGKAWLGTKDMQKDGIYFYKDRTANSIAKNKKTTQDDLKVYGTNFWVFKDQAQSGTDNVYMDIGETEDGEYKIAILVQLKKKASSSNFKNTVEQAIQNGEIKQTITLLEDTDNLSSVQKTYGKAVDLKSTIVYQDVVASKIADLYGLNLRNKDFYVQVDAQHIKYRAYGADDYMTEIYFERVAQQRDYSVLSQKYASTSFSYKDAEGNEYEYFADNQEGYLYVFKNKAYVGPLRVTHRAGKSQEVLNHVNYLFGTK